MDPTVNPARPDSMDASGVTAGVWLRQNAVNLALGAAVVGFLFFYAKLNPLDVVLAAAGLTLIIFLHELGHFAAAKLCNVRVDTFSIGFGPAIPGCSFRYGETLYKLAVVPLGGFVKMQGQEDGVVDSEPDDDPRSYKNQSVLERMFIISAGVVMNVLLGVVLFVVVYMHGLDEKPAEIAYMEPGGAAWRQGLHSGTQIKALGGRQNPWFDDIRPTVWATQEGEKLPVTVEFAGQRSDIAIEPLAEEGAAYPVLGIGPPDSLTLLKVRREEVSPTRPNSPAAAAGFQPGDRIVEMTAPEPGRPVTPVADTYEYHRRMALLAGEPVTFTVEQAGERRAVAVQPAFRRETGLRMRMGAVAAVRVGSAAAKAGIVPGDRIVEVEVADASGAVVYAAGEATAGRRPLDPLRLPDELNRWADRTAGDKRVKVTVLREVDHTEKRVAAELVWEPAFRFDLAVLTGSKNTPVPVNGLGLAYRVQTVVDAVAPNSPAAAAGVQPNDTVTAVRFTVADHKGEPDAGPWQELKPHQWASADPLVQSSAVTQVELKVTRNGQPIDPLPAFAAAADPGFPAEDRGLAFGVEFRVQKAEDVGEALAMGFRRTMRSINGIYLNLYAMVFGRMSASQTLSGPITLARFSYLLAGESIWRLLLLLALISINLAVVNFLPIPVLDGGHMMFLAYEGIRGKPAPERVQTWLTIFGLVCVGCLMLFVLWLDISRLVRGWLKLG